MQFLKGFYQCLRAICTLSLSYKRFATNKDIVEVSYAFDSKQGQGVQNGYFEFCVTMTVF